MNTLDWLVMFGTLALIVAYGTWKSRGSQNIEAFLLGNKTLPWWMVCLSIMATQASAITFLSTPGQAYEDGMRFLQFYFGLPLAMIILSITAVPLYHKLKVFTAYEYLETRFDLKVRTLTAFFFLMLRGLSVGITIYAPSLILSTILGWNINATTLMIGLLVMVYTVSGGTKAVSLTQKYQLTIIMSGMVLTGAIAFYHLPEGIGFMDTFRLAGETGKMNLVTIIPDAVTQNPELGMWERVKLTLADRYNLISGLLGGLFLFLSYFGADQSQVGRYLGGSSVRESRLGLIFNGLLKIPMQFVILYIGILVFLFYQFNQAPLLHNVHLKQKAEQAGAQFGDAQRAYDSLYIARHQKMVQLNEAIQSNDASSVDAIRPEIHDLQQHERALRQRVKQQVAATLNIREADSQDKDYVFINFVMSYLPHGIIGLLMAVVFSAAMSSSAGEMNALASTTTVDIYRRSINRHAEPLHYLKASRWLTAGWAVFAMIFASLANQAENLIQFVNIIGSLFYGTILGVFLSAFYIKYLKATPVFIGAVVAELFILYLYFFQREAVAFLHYNYIGCLVVIGVAFLVQMLLPKNTTPGVTAQ
ncbi:MAG: sodium:solute symporter [Cyclobacteriaceae bacterium]|jgi:SSS family solute:Na+ symporter|nr:sodium:solute symporter [Flammeovirgaceae bacterium]